MTYELHGVAALPHLGIIRAEGEDAAKFLQGQLTQDFALLQPTQARLAAFCSAKGRMQASFVGFQRAPNDFLLICSRDLLAATLKRLAMFVLRSKLKLSDASGDFELRGLAGDAIEKLAGSVRPAWEKLDFDAENLVFLYPCGAQARALWLAPAGAAPPTGPTLDADTWRWGEVMGGVATISSEIVDAFVPQMLNYESVGGVNFKKGCYPGQEVVARSQFRGTLKRRGYVVESAASMVAGDEIFSSDDASQPCGMVAQAASAPQGGSVAIASLLVASAKAGALALRAVDGAAIGLLELPYQLLEDI